MIIHTRTIGAAGLDLIRFYEKMRRVAYLPTRHDVPTIGWGHTRGVKLGDTCTPEQAEAWLKSDCFDAERSVLRRVLVPLNQNQFDALVSFVFNVGDTAFRGSTLLAKLNKSDYIGASMEFPRWDKQNGRVLAGLTSRRFREQTLFRTPEGALEFDSSRL